MPSKRAVIELLKREELQELAARYSLEVVDRRVPSDLINALVRARRAELSDMLAILSRDRLKEVCSSLGLDEGGREKGVLIQRLVTDEPQPEQRNDLGDAVARDGAERDGGVPGAPPAKREVLERLKREELQELAVTYNIDVRDRRVREDLVTGLNRSRRARLEEMLKPLSRSRLKEICEDLGLDDTGKEKITLIARLCGTGPEEPDDQDVPAANAATLLQDLIGPSLRVTGTGSWPMAATIAVSGQDVALDVYVRQIGGSARGNLLERRFQNPSARASITIVQNRPALLLGLWVEQGLERAVIVAMDAYRRAGRATRYSLFMPLSLLETAADTGYAQHENSKGETLHAFRPAGFASRYLPEFLATVPDGRRPSPPCAPSAGTEAEERHGTVDGQLHIRPQVAMYAAFARLNYKPWFALAEFVDNAVQSFLSHRDSLIAAGHNGPLIIDINIDDHEISVTDRAGGIGGKEFPRAFSPATPPTDATGLSEFGIGMKAAACWFSRRWAVDTSALGEDVRRIVHFDVMKISREGIESIPIEVTPAPASDHFTRVTMRDLRVRPKGATLRKIKDHLASIYRVLLKDGVVQLRLTSSGHAEMLEWEPPTLLNAADYRAPGGAAVLWRQDFSHDLGDRRVTGWAGIMAVGSHSLAGFSVFRRRRLIEGSVGETYKPKIIFGNPNSFASQRIVGEMFLEGFEVSHTKDGIHWDGHEDEVLLAIKSQLNTPRLPLIDQAEGYRARKRSASLPSSFGIDALDATIAALDQTETADALRPASELAPATTEALAPTAAAPTVAPPLRSRTLVIQGTRQAKAWKIRVELLRDGGWPFYSTTIGKEGDPDIVIAQLNLEHELSILHVNDHEQALQPLLRMIAALALAEKAAREAGLKNVGMLRSYANEVLGTIARAKTEAGDTP